MLLGGLRDDVTIAESWIGSIMDKAAQSKAAAASAAQSQTAATQPAPPAAHPEMPRQQALEQYMKMAREYIKLIRKRHPDAEPSSELERKFAERAATLGTPQLVQEARDREQLNTHLLADQAYPRPQAEQEFFTAAQTLVAMARQLDPTINQKKEMERFRQMAASFTSMELHQNAERLSLNAEERREQYQRNMALAMFDTNKRGGLDEGELQAAVRKLSDVANHNVAQVLGVGDHPDIESVRQLFQALRITMDNTQHKEGSSANITVVQPKTTSQRLPG